MSDARSGAAQVIQLLPERLEPDVDPAFLGSLLGLCAIFPRAFQELRQVLHHRLAALTVRTCRERSPLVGRLLKDVDPRQVEQEGLEILPFMSREDLGAAQEELCPRGTTLDFCVFTGGTTTGRPLITYVSREEHAYVRALTESLTAVGRREAPTAAGVSVGLARANPHGRTMTVGPEPSGPMVLAAFADDHDLEHAEAILDRSYAVGDEDLHVSALSGETKDVVRLSGLLLERGRFDIGARVQQVQFTGRRVTKRERAMLERFWGGPVLDVFSMSEVLSSCGYCARCDGFHFDPLTSYEVIDPRTRRTCREGRGMLAVTGLYPMKQMTPLIRYLNGDLVEIRPVDCPLGSTAFRPLGSFSECATIEAPAGRYYLASADVVEVLDDLDPVARRRPSGFTAACEWGTSPSFALSSQEGRWHLAVTMRFDPRSFEDSARAAERTMQERLRNLDPVVAEALGSGALRIQLQGPDSATP